MSANVRKGPIPRLIDRVYDFFRQAEPEKPEDTPVGRSVITGQMGTVWASDHIEESKHFTGWNYVAIHTVAKQFSAATVSVKRVVAEDSAPGYKTKDATPDSPGSRGVPIHDHHVLRLIKRPNPMQCQAEWLYQIAQQIRLTGRAYIWEIRNAYGIPIQEWVLPTAWMRPFMGPCEQYPLGAYWVSPQFQGMSGAPLLQSINAGFPLDVREVIPVGWPHPLYPGDGQSPLSACALQIDIAEQQDKATNASFQNEVRPGLVVNFDKDVILSEPEQDRLDQILKSRKAGSSNAWESLWLRGCTVDNFGRSPAELDFVQGRDQSRNTLLAIQQVSAAAAGVTETTAYASFVAAMKQTIELSVQPDLNLLASALTHRWRPIWGDDFEVCLDAKNYDDPVVKLQYIQAKQASKAYTRNEIRAEFGDPPLDGPEGDEIDGVAKPAEAMLEQPGQSGSQLQGLGGDNMLELDDIAHDSGDDESSGMKLPELNASSGNRLQGLISRNGKH
jgi:phage portal protein BeeE